MIYGMGKVAQGGATKKTQGKKGFLLLKPNFGEFHVTSSPCSMALWISARGNKIQKWKRKWHL
jgi:hypothetical protein